MYVQILKVHFQQHVHRIVLHRAASPELVWTGFRTLLVSVDLRLFAKKSAKKNEKKEDVNFSYCVIRSESTWFTGGADTLPLLTCDPCVAPGLGCGSWPRPLPPDGRRLSGTLAGVGDAGAVLLVGPWAFLPVAQPVVLRPCGHLLPLKPAGQRRLSLEVEVPAAAVLLGDLPQPELQVPAQLVVVHRAEQTPADRLSAPDGIHPSKRFCWSLDGKSLRVVWGWGGSCCLPLVSSGQLQGDLKAAGRTMLCLYTMSRGCWLAAALQIGGWGEGAKCIVWRRPLRPSTAVSGSIWDT